MITNKTFPYNKNIESTKLVYIKNSKDLNNFISDFLSSPLRELAIDLEAHSDESYQGLTCLMQISTRTTDYIIDCIALRPYMNKLNLIFTNPYIVKVLHGSDFDVLWLQRDFGLYLVNVFDTGIAARELRYSSKSLAYLLKVICNVDANKQYQLADWRIRPIPEEMLKYAREDTHYLLYIYDVLKYQLIKCSNENIMISDNGLFNKLFKVIEKSNEIALKKYDKPIPGGNNYYGIIDKCGLGSKVQLKVFMKVLLFRDYIARKTDLSNNFVLHVPIHQDLSQILLMNLHYRLMVQDLSLLK